MKYTNTRGNTQEVVYKNCHSKSGHYLWPRPVMFLYGVLESHHVLLSKVRSRIKYGMTSLFNNNQEAGDPQQKHLGMTTLFNNGEGVEDAEQKHLSMRNFNKNKKLGMGTLYFPLTCPADILSLQGEGLKSGYTSLAAEGPFPLRGNSRIPLHHSSSRKVGMREIGAAHALYPALQPCGVTERVVHGFTLIELLVVVLIISILAAVALPQYQKAVTRSRLTAIKPLLFAIKNAHEASYLENGQYSVASAQKWLNLPNTCKTYLPGSNVYDCGHGFLINVHHSDLHAIRVYYCPGNEKNYSYCWTSARDFIYTIYLDHSTHPNWIRCESFTPLGQDICKTEKL